MAQPSRTSVSIDSNTFNAISTNFGVATHHDGLGLPMMGSLMATIDIQVDINDTADMPLRGLFQLANVVTRDKIKDIQN